jgi:hypothetical protein
MDKDKIFYCFDSGFNIINSIDATQGCAFLYVIDLAETKKRMRELGFITDGIDEEGGHFWDDIEVEWTLCTKEEQEEMKKAIEKSEKYINCYQPPVPMQCAAVIRQETPKQKGTFYNLYIKLSNYDEVIQTNIEPISFQDAVDAVQQLNEMNVFGGNIQSFKIEKIE